VRNLERSGKILKEIVKKLSETKLPKKYVKYVIDYLVGLSKHVDVQGVLLYGSFVWGRPRLDSDIDLIIVSKDFAVNRDELLLLKRRIRGSLPAIIDSLWVSENELEEMFRGFTGFVLDAIYKGKVLYDETGIFEKLRNRLLEALKKKKIQRHRGMWRIPISYPGEIVEIEL